MGGKLSKNYFKSEGWLFACLAGCSNCNQYFLHPMLIIWIHHQHLEAVNVSFLPHSF